MSRPVRGPTLAARVLLRQLAADRAVTAAAVALVAVTVLVAVAVLSTVDQRSREAVRQAVAGAGLSARWVTGTAVAPPLSGPAGREDEPYRELMARVDAGAGRELGPLAGPAQWSLSTPQLVASTTVPRAGPVRLATIRADPGWRPRVRPVQGRLPGAGTPGTPVGPRATVPPRVPASVPVVLTVQAARAMRLRVGDRFVMDPASGGTTTPPLRLDLVGIVTPLDPADPYWERDPSALVPLLEEPPNGPVVRTAVALADPAALGVLAAELGSSGGLLTVQVPVRSAAVAQLDPLDALARVRRATSTPLSVPGQQQTLMALNSTLPDLLLRVVAQRAPVLDLAALLVVSLLVAGGLSLLLAARLVAERRRVAVTLALSRGASARQVLVMLGVEGLLLGPPAAALGAALAAPVPGSAGRTGLLLAVAAGLAPALVGPLAGLRLVLPAAPPGLRGERRDVLLRRGRAAGGWLLAALALAAVLALRGRGLSSPLAGPAEDGTGSVDGVGSGPDPLVVLAPVLVAAAVAVPAARWAPAALAGLVRRAGRGGGTVGFLGLARAVRGAGLGALGLTALVTALSVAVLSAVTASTVQAATRDAAARAVAADLRVNGVGFDDDAEQALAGLPGVRAVTGWLELDSVSVAVPADASGARRFTLLAARPDLLQRIQRGLPGARPLAPELTAPVPAGQRMPVAVSAGTAELGDDVQVRPGGRRVEARVVQVLPELPGAPPDSHWVLAPLQPLRSVTGLVLAPDTLLADVGDVPATAAVRQAVRDPAAQLVTPALAAERATSGPLVAVVRVGLPVALLIGAGYTAAAVALTLLLGGRARGRFLAHLRAVGLSGRQSGALVGLEVLPVALLGLLAGTVCGVAMAVLVLPVADLRPLSGAVLPPPVVVGAAGLTLVTGGYLLTVAAAALLAARAARTVSPAAAARTVEDE